MANRQIQMSEDEIRYFERELRDSVNACVDVQSVLSGLPDGGAKMVAQARRIKAGTMLMAMHTIREDKLKKCK